MNHPSPVAPVSMSMSDYVALPEAGGASLSADGSQMAYLSNASGLNQIWLCDMQDGRPSGPTRQITELSERVVSVAFAPRGRDLIYTTDCGMDERYQIWLISGTEGRPRPLTTALGRVHVWGCWSADATQVAFASNERDPRLMDIHVMDLATFERRRVWEGAGHVEPLAFAADGRLLLRDCRRSMRDQDLLWLDPGTGVATPALPHAGPAQYLSVKLDPDARGALVLTDQGCDAPRLCRADFTAQTLTPLHEVAGWEIEKVVLSPDKTSAACVVNRDGLLRIEMVDLATGTATDLGAPGGGVIGALAFAPGTRRLILDFASPTEPGALWGWSAADGFTRLFADIAARPVASHCTPEVLRFDSFDGLAVPYFLYTPAGTPPEAGWPVLFLVHGGPESQWKAQFRADIPHHLQNGIMVVAPNVRGSSGYGRRYCAADDLEKRMDAVQDLIALRDHIAARPDTDAARIAVAGQSYGGFMTLAAMTEAPEKWRCGIDIYGISNFPTLMMTTGPWRQVLRAAEYGDPVRDAELLRQISPITRIDRIAAPLLIVHATDDPRVPIEQGEQVLSALRGLDRPVDYLRIEHEGHGFSRRANKSCVFETIATFLARHL
ncbi:peptidase S9 prolyl oligopeptidase active site domain-containing protein [Alloyangia pacifica]|uniref:Peptidase S9 prolyl oligopeptidase active site domain-containing protein n=1 Tax=Alloyangia pacifica TaxID=311180 RepID=A0A2U8HIN3_9RHOB|nr:S9 family peptidase [Alloyangia pacifica]AWI85787.1 peptidase S9 prolyl oligopeptidase active site domain-containing protein [Alloyangia pacifica]